MADCALQRKNMVESQVRPSDVTDRRIIRAMLDLPREAFVPATGVSVAYMDGEVALVPARGSQPGRSLMAPRTLARLVQALAPEATDKALVVGAGSGYSSALLGRLVERVVAVESDPSLTEKMAVALAATATANVAVIKGDLAIGAPGEGMYNVILVDGSVEEVPKRLLDQLAEGGRLAAIVSSGALSQAIVWQRLRGIVDPTVAFEANAPALPGMQKASTFQF
jgi:protein-L-isoaspartate(D-aspartate) O-methyltransferase